MLAALGVTIDATRIETNYHINSKSSGAFFIFVTSDVENGVVDWEQSVHLPLSRNDSHSYIIPFTMCQCASKRTSVFVYEILSNGVLHSGVFFPVLEFRNRIYSGPQSNIAGIHLITLCCLIVVTLE